MARKIARAVQIWFLGLIILTGVLNYTSTEQFITGWLLHIDRELAQIWYGGVILYIELLLKEDKK